MSRVPLTIRALFLPTEAVPEAVASKRWVLPLVLLCVSGALAGAALAWKWEAEPAVMTQLAMAGELGKLTEQELRDKIQTASRTRMVGSIAGAVFGGPLLVLSIAQVMWLCAWLTGRKAPFAKLWTAAVLCFLPLSM